MPSSLMLVSHEMNLSLILGQSLFWREASSSLGKNAAHQLLCIHQSIHTNIQITTVIRCYMGTVCPWSTGNDCKVLIKVHDALSKAGKTR